MIRNLVPFLRKDNLDKHQAMKALEKENHALKRQLKEKDDEIQHLQEEMDKMRSVLQQMQMKMVPSGLQEQDPSGAVASSVHGASGASSSHSMTAINSQMNDLNAQIKKQGVSAESSSKHGNHYAIEVKKFPKSQEVKQLIKSAIESNEFTQHLDASQVHEIVEAMQEIKFNADEYVIREGNIGDCLYAIQDGVLEVSKKGRTLTRLTSGTLFGELAILYNCTRTASVRALTYSRLWKIERQSFQKIMMKIIMSEENEILSFLQTVPLLKELPKQMLIKLMYSVEICHFSPEEWIIREGAYGDTFYIIRKGRVRVMQNHPITGQSVVIRHLDRGDYFGEKALLSEDRRTASVVTETEVQCVEVDRRLFVELIGPLEEIRTKKYSDHHQEVMAVSKHSSEFATEFQSVKLADFHIMGTIGQGGFGRVDLVKHIGKDNQVKTYALKCLKKKHVVELKQQDHLYSEKQILLASNSPFIIKLFRTFRDKKYVYMLMEVCLGGELWTHMNQRMYLSDTCAKFSVACVVLAFEYLHHKGIIYRDLKPENLLLTNNGYVKLCDFGFAKTIGLHAKTWTFCGTPEYTAPEIILNKGHDFAADYWALGILVYELLNGIPPFTGGDAMKTYSMILRGVDALDIPTKRMHKNSVHFMRKCCKLNPLERLGYQKNGFVDIKKHKWFESFDWVGLENCKLHPPFKIKVKNALDSSNFEFLNVEKDYVEEETSGWDDNF